ncbi:hypothetical protein F9278_36365 [Streptomyces phaeolivaceus]|uniref:HTH luxR-type domain-containing protein n=1 Tax=Streptomyces phaeolivaceus TaxID=2653200 RepID=A0A5P8KC82_9ACTN|nr:hypothetical protein [Streptomyces phaeolivaceus]QFR00752.1 hypothetical protein F9278_36365 [Streptomyces phaeolivaceus]
MTAIDETRAAGPAGKDTHGRAVGGVHPAPGLPDKVLAQLRAKALVLPRGTRPGQGWSPRTDAEMHLLTEGRRLDHARQLLLAEVGRLRHALGTPRGDVHEKKPEAEKGPQGRCPLSATQLSALIGASRGETLQETAERLRIPYETARTRRSRAISQLKARSATHAVAIAMAAGWITPWQPGGGEGR